MLHQHLQLADIRLPRGPRRPTTRRHDRKFSRHNHNHTQEEHSERHRSYTILSDDVGVLQKKKKSPQVSHRTGHIGHTEGKVTTKTTCSKLCTIRYLYDGYPCSLSSPLLRGACASITTPRGLSARTASPAILYRGLDIHTAHRSPRERALHSARGLAKKLKSPSC